MTKVLDNGLPVALTVMTLLLIGLITVSGITGLVTFLAIIYVALGGFYTGYVVGARQRKS